MTATTLDVGAGERITDRERRRLVILSHRPELTVTWSRHAPGETGTELHIHRQHVDAFYVLSGELTFFLGPRGEPVALAAGSFVAVPPNVVHAFRNESDGDVSWLNFHAPDAGFADYLRGISDVDNFDPPADGGLPAAEATVAAPLAQATVPGLHVAVGGEGELAWRLDDGRVLAITARR
jgi:quercetin dioxygenase-like cupin family protein